MLNRVSVEVAHAEWVGRTLNLRCHGYLWLALFVAPDRRQGYKVLVAPSRRPLEVPSEVSVPV